MQMARSLVGMAHRVFVEESEDERGRTKYRWECSCRKHGRPALSRAYAEDLGRQHVKRSTPKQPGPKGLRSLLDLNGE